MDFSKAFKQLSVVAIFLAASLVVISKTDAQSSKGNTLKYDPKKDTLYTAKTGGIEDKLTLSGSISTDQITNVKFQNSGKLVWVGVKVGDYVKKGQALASLDRSELRKNLATQFNNYRSQLSQFNDVQDQYKTTKDKYLVTDTIQRILDRTQYSLENSVINYELTDMSIKESTIYSPINGIVTAVDQPIAGNYITSATATFTIVDPNGLFFESEIDQEKVNQIFLSQKAFLKLDSFPDDGELESKINFISFTPVSGQTSTVYNVRFQLPVDNSKFQYRLGMDGDVSIVLAKSENAILIPTDAVSDDNGQKYVYLKKDKELVRQNIKTGIETDTDTEVLEGLNVNETVVVTQK